MGSDNGLVFFTILDLNNGLINNINDPVHFFAGDDQCRSERQHIALNGFSQKPLFQAFEHYDFSLIHRSLFGFGVADQIYSNMQAQAGDVPDERMILF